VERYAGFGEISLESGMQKREVTIKINLKLYFILYKNFISNIKEKTLTTNYDEKCFICKNLKVALKKAGGFYA